MAVGEVKIDIHRCKGCGFCVTVCSINIIRMSEEANEMGNLYAEVIKQNACTGCALCFQMCPDLAIEVRKSEEPRIPIEAVAAGGKSKKELEIQST